MTNEIKAVQAPQAKSILGLISLEGKQWEDAVAYLNDRIEGRKKAVCSFEAESLTLGQKGLEMSLARSKHQYHFWHQEAVRQNIAKNLAEGNPAPSDFESKQVMQKTDAHWEMERSAEKAQRKHGAKKEQGKALIMRAGYYFQDKKFNLALADITNALKIFTELDSKKWMVIGLNERALINLQLGKFDDAIADLNRIFPEEKLRVENRYQSWAKRSDFPSDQSMTTLKHPFAIALHNRGVALHGKGDAEGAKASFDAAKKFEPAVQEFMKTALAELKSCGFHSDKLSGEAELDAIKKVGLVR